jgi:hypothetical protein
MQSSLYAQSLSQRFRELFTFGSCGQPLCLEVGGEHGLHFIPSVTQGEHDLLAFLTGSVANTLASLPFVSATSGVTFRIVNGQAVATSLSAGAIFAERAQTLGRGRLLSGVNVNQLEMRKLRGVRTRDLVFRFAHQNVGGAAMGDPVFENDIIEVGARFDLNLLVTSIYASYGVHDNIDVGILIPVVNVGVDGISEARVLTFATPTPRVRHDGKPSGIRRRCYRRLSSWHWRHRRAREGAPRSESWRWFRRRRRRASPYGRLREFPGQRSDQRPGDWDCIRQDRQFRSASERGFHISLGGESDQLDRGRVGFDHLIADRVTFVGDILADLQTRRFQARVA